MEGRAPPASLVVRDAGELDMAAVQRIYAHNVQHGRASFEETPPTLEEMLERRKVVLSLGLPYLIADVEGQVAGYSYATSYRPRPAYRFTVEDSVYVADSFHGQGHWRHPAWRADRAVQRGSVAPDARDHRRQWKCIVHCGSPSAGVRARRHAQIGRLQAGYVDRYGADATIARGGGHYAAGKMTRRGARGMTRLESRPARLASIA
jgi:hypothetical protein